MRPFDVAVTIVTVITATAQTLVFYPAVQALLIAPINKHKVLSVGARGSSICRTRITTPMLSVGSWNDELQPECSTSMKRLVLIGGGHSHVQVIKAFHKHSRPSNTQVTLIDLQPSATYSGMVPGCLSKLYTFDQAQISLDSLATWAGIDFVCGRVLALSIADDSSTKSNNNSSSSSSKVVLVEIASSSNKCHDQLMSTTIQVPFDVLSIDIGSTSRDYTKVPGAKQYCIPTRPISDLVRRIEMKEEALKDKISAVGASKCLIQVVVVGGGAAGIELSLAMRARWDTLFTPSNSNSESTTPSSQLSILLIDCNDKLLPGENSYCQRALTNILKKYHIDVRHNLLVKEVTSTHVHVHSNNVNNDLQAIEAIPFTHCIWATGAQAHDLSWTLKQQCGLSISKDRGWILVNEYLQSISHPYIFASGDCCEMVNRTSPPKAGVYAVRTGPTLIANLAHALNADVHTSLEDYIPQDDFLKLLMCGDGTALGFRFGLPLYGEWVWKLKDHIDLMFMNLFDVHNLPKYSGKHKEGLKKYDTKQYDELTDSLPLMNPEDAAKLLLRVDEGVDFLVAWNILRSMTTKESYRLEVLNFATVQLESERDRV